MRVCLDARFLGYAGIGRFVRGLWEGLLETGVDVVGLQPARAGGDWLGEHGFAPAGPGVASNLKPFGPAQQVLLPGLLKRSGVSVYHSPHLSLPYLSRLPLVLTVHDLFPLLHPEAARSRAAAAYYRVFFPLALRRADAIVVVSAAVLEQFDEMGLSPRRRPQVIEHGLDDQWRRRTDEEIAEVLGRRGVSRPYLLYVGTSKPHKNLATLLRALRPDHPPLVLAGPTGREVTEDLGEAGTGRHLVPLGRVSSDLPALYSGAEALLLPSLSESVGFPVLEAMACGTPVIASDGGGLPASVGDAGLVVPALDAGAWTAAVDRLLSDSGLRADLVRRGLERVGGRTWRKAAAEYLGVYRSLAI